jgi:hypothetical protein
MKKTTKLALFLLTFSLILSVFVACNSETLAERTEREIANMTDREKSDYFSNKSDEYYKNGLTSIQKIEGTMSGKMMGVEMTSRLEGTETKTEKNFGKEDMSFISVSEFKTTTEVMNEKQSESYTKTEAFHDGYMYYSYVTDSSDANKSYLKSLCTAEEYADYRTSANERDPDVDITKDCKNVSVKKSEDGKLWVLTFSDPEYSEASSIQKFAKAFASLPVELTVEEFSATLSVDVMTNALISSEMEIAFSADESDCEVSLEIKASTTYALPAPDANFLPENHSNYTETGCIIDAYYALYALDDVISSNDASMELSTITKIDVIQGGQTFTASSYKETDEINYLRENGVFKYYITADVETASGNQAVAQKLAVDYDGIKQKIYVDGILNSSTDQGQATAKNFIFTTLKAFKKDLISAVSIDTVKSDGETKVTIELFLEPEIVETYAAEGFEAGSLDVSKHVIVITLDKNNAVESADYNLMLDGSLNAGGASIKSKLIQGASISKISSADSSLFEN